MTTRYIRLTGLCGILSPIVTLSLIFIAIGMSPWFNWHNNALSDLGISHTPNPFNATLIGGGLMYLVFVGGFLHWTGLTSRLSKLAAICLVAGALGLPLIGLLPEDIQPPHYIVAVTYFLATPLAYLLFGSDWLRRGRQLPGALTLAAGLTAILMIGAVPHKRIAVPEILAALVMAVWTFAIGMKLLIEPEELG